MKKLVSAAMALGVIAGVAVVLTTSQPVSSQGQMSGQIIPGHYIVTVKRGVDPQSVAREHGVAASAAWKHALNGFAGPASPGQVAELRRDSRVGSVEPDRLILLSPSEVRGAGGPPTGSPPPQAVPNGIKRIGANQNSMGSYDGSGSRPVAVNVAVIDTGIDLTHPELNVQRNVTFVNGTKSGTDDNGHGTHVAGTIAARDNAVGVVGVAPGAPLWAVKVLDRNGSGALSQVISGINYVTQNAATVKVANMSLGMTGTSAAGDTALNNSVAAGVTYCVAAGNEKLAASGSWPASNPNVIAVSALSDYNGAGPCGGTVSPPASSPIKDPDDSFASYSNFGNPPVDVCAPGTNIYSTYKGGSYATLSGTSMATPHATGSCALFIAYQNSVNAATNPQSVKNAVVYNAKLQSDSCFGLQQPSNDPGVEPILYAPVLTPAPAGYVAPQ